MTVFTEGRHAAEFILTEANGQRSRENGTVASGQKLVAGQVVQDNGSGKIIAADGLLNTAGDVSTAVKGILIYPVDASATGTNADTKAAYLARDAEVNGKCLTYPTETTAGGQKAAAIDSLRAIGIIVRDDGAAV